MNEKEFDAIIIGGGVVGCAVFRELTSKSIRCVLCEQNDDILSGASSGNSGTLHTGFDAPQDSTELYCIKTSTALAEDFFLKNNVPFRTCGALVVAWTPEDLEKLQKIVEHARTVGIDDVAQICRDELFKLEPNLNRNALGAVHVPRETIVDPWSFPAALACQGLSHGGTILTGCKVENGAKDHRGWSVVTNKGRLTAKIVINCSGLFGDLVENIVRPSPFTVKPRKGQFAVFNQSANQLLNSVIFPVPTERTKGVLLFPSIYGNIVVGPTAEDQDDRCNAEIDSNVINQLVKRAHFMLPSLKDHDVVGTYAGLRPATQYKDYQIQLLPDQDWLTVSGIRSTGLTACLGIAKHVASLLESKYTFSSSNNAGDFHSDGNGKQFDSKEKTLTYGNQSWKITHPLTGFGIETTVGLEMFKRFLLNKMF